ncbi:MAG: hypothetical protein II784_06265 [Oscillospiraceae bacterium]|nr:hypothetical protein [Oscillospiraceae bacterium]
MAKPDGGENIHANHRRRIKEKYIEHGLDVFADHEVLELILTFAIPRMDVNPTAHALLRHFGSLRAVFRASVEELCEVDGIGENAAVLISLFNPVYRRAEISRADAPEKVRGVAAAGALLGRYYIGLRDETVYAMALDAHMNVLRVKQLFRGTFNSAQISIQKVLELAISTGAAFMIISHNHPGGYALPSDEDIDTTHRLESALDAVGVRLVDHLIFADDGDFVSLADSNALDTLKRQD